MSAAVVAHLQIQLLARVLVHDTSHVGLREGLLETGVRERGQPSGGMPACMLPAACCLPD